MLELDGSLPVALLGDMVDLLVWPSLSQGSGKNPVQLGDSVLD